MPGSREDLLAAGFLAVGSGAASPDPELQLWRRVRLLEGLIESSPDRFYAFDPRGRCLFASERAASATGLVPAQMVGRTWQELGWDPGYAPLFQGMLRLVLETGELIEDARAVPTPAGVVHTEYVLAPLRGPRGEIEGVAVTARDVSARLAAEMERRAAEVELQTRDELFRAVMEGSQDAIFVKDGEGRYRMMNSAGARYLGHSVEEVVGRTDAELVVPGNERLSVETDRAVMATGEPVVYERFATFHGEERFFITSKSPWRDAKGTILGVFGVARDTTARKRMEEELRQRLEAERLARRAAEEAGETAQKAVRQRDDVLAVVSHDLRNALGVFRLTSAVLSKELPEEAGRARERIAALEAQAAGMGRLVDDLVEVARIDAGSLRIVPAGCEARALAQDAAAAVQPLAQQKGIRLAVQAPDGPAPVHCDRGRILQVFANVLGNAVKFSDGGEVRLEVATGEGEVRFSIRDTGGGISPEHLPHLFERYWQGSQGERSGAGLGLYIARGIVEAHGGRIWADSTPGQGTIISFALPSG